MSNEAFNIEWLYPLPGIEHITISEHERQIYETIPILLRFNQFEEATELLFKVESNRRSSFPFLRVQSTIAFASGDWKGLVGTCKALVKKFPKYLPGLHYMAIGEFRAGHPAKAMKILARCLKKHPWDCAAKCLECTMLGALGDVNGAFEAWKESLILAGNFPGKTDNQHRTAVQHLIKASETNPLFKPISDRVKVLCDALKNSTDIVGGTPELN